MNTYYVTIGGVAKSMQSLEEAQEYAKNFVLLPDDRTFPTAYVEVRKLEGDGSKAETLVRSEEYRLRDGKPALCSVWPKGSEVS